MRLRNGMRPFDFTIIIVYYTRMVTILLITILLLLIIAAFVGKMTYTHWGRPVMLMKWYQNTL